MSRSSWIAAVLAIVIVGSGCTSKGIQEQSADGSSPGPSSDGGGSDSGPGTPSTSAAPLNLSEDERKDYGLDPTPGAPTCTPPASVVKVDYNATFEGPAHVHDYWKGRTDVVIWDKDIVPGSSAVVPLPVSASGPAYFTTPGAYVYPGTDAMTFKMTWTQTIPDEKRKLSYDMPGDALGGSATDWLFHTFAKPGESWTLPINLTNADPPHLNVTLWHFAISNPDLNQQAGAHLTWSIHRGYECLPVDPPHYDLWKGQNSLVIMDGEKPSTYRKTPGASSGGMVTPPIAKNHTIPPETKLVKVTLTWPDSPTNWKLGLRFCEPTEPCGRTGSVTRTATKFTEPKAGTRIFEITPAPEWWDSPYDQNTKWTFTAYPDNGALTPALADSGNFDGTVHWTIEASR